MRKALSPLLYSSRCLLASRATAKTRPHTSQAFAHQQQPCRTTTAGFATTQHLRRWDLSEVLRVTEETSPLIFHLTSDNPYHNLSLEHYILTNSHPSSTILLFYTNRPCVVIGRNQNPWLETDIQKLRDGLEPEEPVPLGSGIWGNETTQRNPIDLIRRRSGGGTVFHDNGNLNYSVIVPNNKSFKRSTQAEMVVRALTPLAPRYGFSDLQVNDRNDIVMKAKDNALQWLKVSGSAYKLTKGRALHHGTLLFSSPNLSNISNLLRSPGRGFIEAKGVESVRSHVANLAWTSDLQQRKQVKEVMTKAIVQQFWETYGNNQRRKVGHNEIFLGSEVFQAMNNPSLTKGLEELQTDLWLYEGTPRFDFASGAMEGTEVKFQANHGAVVSLTVEHHDKQYTIDEAALRSVSDQNGHGSKLLGIFDWYNFISARVQEATNTHLRIPRTLARRIDAIFPGVRGTPRKLKSDS
ncbi:hypothetical protein LTR84_001470 [Exophiala bonariae]|uniref:Putative lipoate-protein ligase A n=1 Tax=Exophiala bonariae TaxID=1690606 RepID=A0AAV9NCT9_9EURO|nr:hypothetical protein LTR84_001470 [Exophiala bonariae]